MNVTPEQLLKDPTVIAYTSVKGGRITQPIEALGEKRVVAHLVGLPSTEIRFLNEDKSRLPYVVSAAERQRLSKDYSAAITVFVTADIALVVTDLIKKIRTSYNASDVRPAPKPLPFNIIYLTSSDGFMWDTIPVSSVMFSKNESGDLVALLHKNDHFYYCHLKQEFGDAIAIFLEEKISRIEKTKPTRQFRKASEKLGFKDNDNISVISLRAVDRSGDAPGLTTGQTDREYYSQWLVRGHVRNQWMPSRDCHEVRWIDPYVKGPDGAPFKESVRHVVR